MLQSAEPGEGQVQGKAQFHSHKGFIVMLLDSLSIGLQETEMGRHVKYMEGYLRTFADLYSTDLCE